MVAERQGQTAALNMLGHREKFIAVPFFWSQHYDVSINYVGHAERWDEIAVDGDIAARDCLLRFRRDGRVLAVASIFRDIESLEAEVAMEREGDLTKRAGTGIRRRTQNGGTECRIIERSQLMSTVQQELNITSGVRTIAPAQHYSAIVKFINEVAKGKSNETPTSVVIFEVGDKWYCQVCRGDEKTQPMGPYTKQQAEQIQDARKTLIAKRGTLGSCSGRAETLDGDVSRANSSVNLRGRPAQNRTRLGSEGGSTPALRSGRSRRLPRVGGAFDHEPPSVVLVTSETRLLICSHQGDACIGDRVRDWLAGLRHLLWRSANWRGPPWRSVFRGPTPKAATIRRRAPRSGDDRSWRSCRGWIATDSAVPRIPAMIENSR